MRPRDDVARSFFLVVVLSALLAGSVYILRPFLPGLIWAGTIVVATWPLLLWLQRRVGNRRWLAVLIIMACLLVVMVLPLYLTIDTFAERANDIVGAIRRLPTYTLFPPPSWLREVPLVGPRATVEWQRLSDVGPGGLLARVEPYLTMAARWVLGHAAVVGAFAVHMVITLVFAGILYVRGEVVASFIRDGAVRLAGPGGEVAVVLAGQAIRAVAMGIVLTAAAQTALGGLGLWVAGVPVAGILTAVMLLLCIAQIGPLVPMLAGVIFLYRADANIAATLLLLWSIVVGTMDNVMRPWLISRGVRISLLLILCGVIGGLLAFGLVGLFIGPVVLAVTQAMLRAWVQGTPLVSETLQAADAKASSSQDLSSSPGIPPLATLHHSAEPPVTPEGKGPS
ncbi:hypothetical protein C7R54_25445 [Achromobacter aloeverae]|uniref:AI-2E family transporter YdiK n=2 Tax=Achromobacter aloeverae TaxID=1750518 RepID=A0A4Q1HDF6_9BURK|nr:hypothetical protein C7R54_25445 [Achromobacter aloeverae]